MIAALGTSIAKVRFFFPAARKSFAHLTRLKNGWAALGQILFKHGLLPRRSCTSSVGGSFFFLGLSGAIRAPRRFERVFTPERPNRFLNALSAQNFFWPKHRGFGICKENLRFAFIDYRGFVLGTWAFCLVSGFGFSSLAVAESVLIRDRGAEVFFPRAIADVLNDELEKNKIKEGFQSFQLKLLLTEKTKGLLNAPDLAIQLPNGGGTVDLANYMGHRTGSFLFKIDFNVQEKEGESIEVMHAWFVSRYPKTKIDGEDWGLGCNQFVKLDERFFKKNDAGLLVNTTQGRHMYVVGGEFIFLVKVGKIPFLTLLKVKDQRYQDQACEDHRESKKNQ